MWSPVSTDIALRSLGAATPKEAPLRVGVWVLLAWFSMAVGLVVGSLSTASESVDRVWHVISYLFLPLSGALFMVDWLPKRVQELALFIPTVNCTELLREGYFGTRIHAHYDLSYLIVVNVALIVTNIFQVSVAVDAVVTEIPFVMTRVSPIFGKSGGVTSALVACNVGAVVIQIASVVVNVLLILANIANVALSVAAIPAQIAAIVPEVFLILRNISGRGAPLAKRHRASQQYKSNTHCVSSHLSLS